MDFHHNRWILRIPASIHPSSDRLATNHDFGDVSLLHSSSNHAESILAKNGVYKRCQVEWVYTFAVIFRCEDKS